MGRNKSTDGLDNPDLTDSRTRMIVDMLPCGELVCWNRYQTFHVGTPSWAYMTARLTTLSHYAINNRMSPSQHVYRHC